MANIGEINVGMTLDAEDFGRGLSHAQAGVRTFAHEIDGIGSLVKGVFAGIAVQRVGGFLFDVAKQAAHAEEAINGFAVIFGNGAGDVERFSRDMADKFNISLNDILDAEGRLGSLFQGAGFDAGRVSKFSKELGSLAVDYARFKNVTVDESFSKILSGLSGESEPLRAFGIFLNDAEIKAQALKLGLGGLHRELTEGEKIQARYAFIMEKGQVAMGAAAREADGAAAKIEALSGAWENFAVSFGELVAPAVAAVSREATNLLNDTRHFIDWAKGEKDQGLAEIRDMIPDGPATAEAAGGIAAAVEASVARILPAIKDGLKGVAMDPEALGYKAETPRAQQGFSAAALRGSAEAASVIFRTKFGVKGNEAVASNTKATATNTAAIAAGINVMTGKLEVLKTNAAPDWR